MFHSPRRLTSFLARSGLPLAVGLTAAGLLAACGGTSSSSSAVAPPVQTVAPTTPPPPGAALYLQSCARCHGSHLQGKGATPAIDQLRLAGLGDQRLRLTIASGKGQMHAFGGLSPTQVDALVSYLQEVAA